MSAFIFIKNQLNILDVIQEYTSLKRAGLYWKGHCPFHHEKTASFTVSPNKGIFYCFGCHSGGDLINFIAKIENCTPLEAVQHLANRYNLTLPENSTEGYQKEAQEKERYFTVCKLVAQWCHLMLEQSPAALQYLQKRDINKQSQQLFTIGYFPGGIQGIRSLLTYMKQHALLADDLVRAGILKQGKTVLYSAFEERIIFPITDPLGRFCGFGGRIFKPDDTRAKYYNSSENQFFTKGSLLFGLDIAKKSIQKNNAVFLVEGYTDCVAMIQHGYENTVATLGTACTVEHLTLLSRYAHRVFALYDGDNAGQEAILRLAELSWQASIDPYVICLPTGDDPASFLQGNNDLTPYIDKATDILIFFVETLGNQFSDQPLREKLRLTRKILHIIALIDDELKRDLLLQRTSAIVQIPVATLEKELKSSEPKNSLPPTEPVILPDSKGEFDQRLEKKIFFAIMNNVQLLNGKLSSFLPYFFPDSWGAILSRLAQEQKTDPSFTFSSFFEMLTTQEQQLISSILMAEEQEVQPQEFASLVAQLQRKHWKKIAHTLKDQLAQANRDDNKEAIEKIMREFLELKQAIVPTDLM